MNTTPLKTTNHKAYQTALLTGAIVLGIVINSFSLSTQLFVQRAVFKQVAPLSSIQQQQEAQTLFKAVWQSVLLNYYQANFNNQTWQYWLKHYQHKLKTTDDSTVAIQTMLASLNDPYSVFLPPQRFESQALSIASKLFGVGLQLENNLAGQLVVTAIVPEAPASKAGLLPNDVITAINAKPTQGMPIETCAKLIRGEKGSMVSITIVRKNGSQHVTKTFNVVRDEIKFKTVETFSFKHFPTVGYIRLNSFISEQLMAEIKQALTTFKTKKSLIIDVRGNLGGLLENAIELSDLFLDEGTIVTIKSRNPQHQQVASAHNGQSFTGRLVVLTDKASASASEVFAGAMKDHNRATLMGTRTFGKGLVQQVLTFEQQDALNTQTVGLNLTVAQYLTPNGTNIHGVGIAPHIVVKQESTEALLQAFKASGVNQHNSMNKMHALNAHIQALVAKGEKEAAWLQVDKPLKMACQWLESK